MVAMPPDKRAGHNPSAGPTRETTCLDPGEVTRLLRRWSGGDQGAFDALLPVVYEELHALAGRYLRRERPDHTLPPTGLVHEAYLRLVGADPGAAQLESRTHFFAMAAQAMRRILIEHARRYAAARRMPPSAKQPLREDSAARGEEQPWLDLLALNQALEQLRNDHPRQAQVVELRYFGGLSETEIAHMLDLSRAPVSRDWRVARLLLGRLLRPAVAS